MKSSLTKLFLVVFFAGSNNFSNAQLVVTPYNTALELAQKLVGDGVTISNVSFTGSVEMASFFNNTGGTSIGIDSGIVLTSGAAITRVSQGVDGPAYLNADNSWNFPGDIDLTTLIGSQTEDACVLQFDFIPLGDSIRFNYVFSSEEYPEYACQGFNDAFAFFISGPGITGLKNIALIPNSTSPVTINNINNIPGCGLFPQYYIDNQSSNFFTHDGHTTVLTARERVQPCEVYTLKIVIADVGDDLFDSGVFLEARSLSSSVIGMSNSTQIDPVSGLSYLVEGCNSGSFNVSRPRRDPYPLVVNFSFGGSAINGSDYQSVPSSVIIPANDSFVTVNIIPIVDGIPEGIEEIKVYALAGCSSGTVTDSTIIQIRDYDILSLAPDTAFVCSNNSIQLIASIGYTSYQWLPDPTLSSTSIRDPLASPVNNATTYVCTATIGNCNARDSVLLFLKNLEFLSKVDVNCRGAATGGITVTGGPEWQAPREFSLNGINWQPDSSFNNLIAGTYWVKMRDANCVDSIQVTIAQAFPDLLFSAVTVTPASCSGNPDGMITITASGGNNTYEYSKDGTSFQTSNVFNVASGNYVITIRDGNGCLVSQNVTIDLTNTVTADAGVNGTICEGNNYILQAFSNANSFSWTPAGSLNNSTILNPSASPTVNTRYYLTATTGVCSRIDSVDVFVRPAPIADAGADVDICYGKIFPLQGSGGISFEWSPSTYFISPTTVQNPDVKATGDITYALMVTDQFNCRSLIPDLVKIDVVPAVRIFAGNDTVAAINQPLQLNVREMSNAGVSSYTWTPANTLTGANTTSPVATLQSDQRYLVVGTTAAGCQGIDDILVKVYKGPDIYVPSGFTPNNDGLNDRLRPIPVGIKDFKFFRVFNRWGQLIYSTNDPKDGWDGRVKGTEQGTGVFVWMAEAIDFKGNLVTRKGVVSIIR